MKTLKSASFLVIIFSAFLLLPGKSLAAVPTLSLTSFNNNSVQVIVNGDPNSSVNLYYYSIGNSNVNNIGNIGTTNSSGYFSTNLNNGSYNIPVGSNTYTVVNGQQSNQVNWPYNNNGCYYSNGYYNCPNNNSANYSNPVIYTQIEPNNYSGVYGNPSAGVFLSQVPATGGVLNFKMVLFFLGLFSWSTFLSYIYLTRRALKKALKNI